jgi:hypothetical protein
LTVTVHASEASFLRIYNQLRLRCDAACSKIPLLTNRLYRSFGKQSTGRNRTSWLPPRENNRQLKHQGNEGNEGRQTKRNNADKSVLSEAAGERAGSMRS